MSIRCTQTGTQSHRSHHVIKGYCTCVMGDHVMGIHHNLSYLVRVCQLAAAAMPPQPLCRGAALHVDTAGRLIRSRNQIGKSLDKTKQQSEADKPATHNNVTQHRCMTRLCQNIYEESSSSLSAFFFLSFLSFLSFFCFLAAGSSSPSSDASAFFFFFFSGTATSASALYALGAAATAAPLTAALPLSCLPGCSLPRGLAPSSASVLPSSCLMRASTLARASMPMAASALSPSASTRMASAHLAASTREILPLNLGELWPMSDAW
mmetsp:Transcript_21551/g.54841  ORF Transcript_21551/g.54841 Transcript_21551/m.54841 type:complete len:265 (-) Transcript_21551:1205-1999(-)